MGLGRFSPRARIRGKTIHVQFLSVPHWAPLYGWLYIGGPHTRLHEFWEGSLRILGSGAPLRRHSQSGSLKSTFPGPREGSSILNVQLVVVAAAVSLAAFAQSKLFDGQDRPARSACKPSWRRPRSLSTLAVRRPFQALDLPSRPGPETLAQLGQEGRNRAPRARDSGFLVGRVDEMSLDR